MICNFSGQCKEKAKFSVVHKFGTTFVRNACPNCAKKIGEKSPDGAVINMPNRESKFYKIEDIKA